jgi:hypothetical protein
MWFGEHKTRKNKENDTVKKTRTWKEERGR